MRGSRWDVKISQAEGKAGWYLRISAGATGCLSRTSNAMIAEIEYWKGASNAVYDCIVWAVGRLCVRAVHSLDRYRGRREASGRSLRQTLQLVKGHIRMFSGGLLAR